MELLVRLVLLFYVIFIPGFFLARVILPKKVNVSVWLVASVVLSLLTLYPASILTVFIEGRENSAIFQPHLPHSMLALAVISFGYILINLFFRITPNFPSFKPRIPLALVLIMIFYSCLVFFNLDWASVMGDEYDINYQAYDLIDGVADGRKSFLLSFNTHPPMIMNVSHYLLQIINPGGLETLADWQFRFPEAMMGIVVLGFTYVLTEEVFGKKQPRLPHYFWR